MPARASTLVALGDSYAAGVGTRTYYQESGSCRRSPKAYGAIVAARLGAQLELTACSGARIFDVEANQLGPLGDAGWVTVTVGGNDAGFGDVITSCALPWPWICRSEIDASRRYIRKTLPGQLDGLFAIIASRAPSARVAAVGYPRAFDGKDCDPATFFSSSDQEMLDRTADLLARIERTQALAHGFLYVDPRRAFDGHEICDSDPWINGLSYPVVESYHPNVPGYRAYARLVFRALRSSVWDRRPD